LLEQVTSTRSAVLIQDVDFDPRFSAAQSIVSQGIKCAMGVPLITSGQVRGVLYLDTVQRTHAFSNRDLHLLNGIANQAAIALENASLLEQIRTETTTRVNLARFLSPALVEQAEKGKIDIARGGVLTEVTILFSDIRGFTSMSEKESAQDTVRMLNDYFELMVEVVFETGGVLDKFIGDALMALWGAPVKRPDDAERAVRAALEMQRRMVGFNRLRASAGRPPVGIGIGINTGSAVVGNMGSSRRMEYTAIGDAVNLASRLCHEARANEILIGENTRRNLSPSLFELDTSLPPARVKGKEKPIPVARVLDFAVDRTALT
jgi:adenylate cyclase